MAPFNPEIQKEELPVHMIGWQERGITTPKPNLTASSAITGVSNVVDAAIQGVDFVEKKNIDDKLFHSIDSLQQQTIAALKSADPALDTSPQSGQPSLLNRAPGSETTKRNIPPALNNLTNQLETLGNATNNKLASPSYLNTRITDTVQQALAEFPGHRDHVIQAAEKYAERRDANKTLSSLYNDINSYRTALNEKKSRAESFIFQHPGVFKDASVTLKYLRDTGDDIGVLREGQKRLKAEEDLKYRDLELTNAEKEMKFKSEAGAGLSGDEASHEFQKALHDTTVFAAGGRKNLFDLAERASRGEDVGFSSENWQQGQRAVTAVGDKVSDELWAKWHQPGPPGKDGKPTPSRASIVGDTKLKEILEANRNETVTKFARRLTKEDIPLALASKEANDAIANDLHNIILKDDFARVEAAAGKTAPEWFKLYTSKNLPAYQSSPAAAASFNYIQNATIGQKGLTFGPAGEPPTGEVHTINDSNEVARKTKAAEQPEFNKNYIDFLGNTLGTHNPAVTPEARRNTALSVFDDSARGFIKDYAKTQFDPVTGKYNAGQYWVYNRLFNHATAQQLKKLGDADVLQKFHDAGENEFGIIFRPEIASLSKIQDDPNLRISWDSDLSKFSLDVRHMGGKWETGYNYKPHSGFSSANEATEILNRLNIGLNGYKAVKQSAGGDVDSGILRFLMGHHSAEGVDWEKVGGLPGKIRDAVVAASIKKHQAEAEEETRKRELKTDIIRGQNTMGYPMEFGYQP